MSTKQPKRWRAPSAAFLAGFITGVMTPNSVSIPFPSMEAPNVQSAQPDDRDRGIAEDPAACDPVSEDDHADSQA